jgi:prepilin-type N-terminal cleavage/methylation domain-containing protein
VFEYCKLINSFERARIVMTFHKSQINLRRGLTLVELLVVFAIIAILAGLTATAVFKVIGVQQANNTQLTIKTLSSYLDREWASVISQNKNNPIPASVLAMAGGDPRRARVIWNYLKLKQEFPMNLSEAQFPFGLPAQVINAGSLGGASATACILQVTDLPAKPGYKAALLRASQIAGASFNISNDGTIWPFESAYTLIMALQQSRSGSVLAEENLAANAMAAELFIWQPGPPPQQSKTPFLTGPKMLVDAWTTPLAFYRWPIGNTDFQAATSGSPISSAARSAKFPNPLDPEGTLTDPRWNNFNNWSSFQGVWWFEKYCHTIHTGNSLATYRPYASYSEPVIVSAGPDHLLGVQAPSGVTLQLSSASVSAASPLLPDLMSVDVLSTDPWFDNIASYKLRTGATGDK